jgi:hypothetical protein
VHRFGGVLREKAGMPSWVNPEYSSDPELLVAE